MIDNQSTYEDFLERAELFRAANKMHDLAWYSALATSNFNASRNKTACRSLLGLFKYCLIELPWRTGAVVKKYDMIFASVFIKREGAIHEAFFGDLPKALSDDGVRCAVVGKIAWNYKRADELQASNGSDVDAFCPTHLLSKWDGLKCVFKSLAARFSFDGMTPEQAKKSRDEMCSAQYHDIIIGLFYQKMLERLRNSNAKIIHAFEGNSWESACAIVDDNAVGYQHGAVLKNQVKMTPFDGRPTPSTIITSGAESSRAITALTGISSSRLVNGYALRLGCVYNHEPKKSYPSKIRTALFLMQNDGGADVEKLKEFQVMCPNVNIILRPHPAHPIDDVKGLELSNEADLYQDILNHDVCLYSESTAAFEAIALGVPVLHIGGEGDPLFLCSAMRFPSHDKGDFKNAIDLIENNKNFKDDFKVARDYFENYFKQPDDQMVKNFKTWLTLS